MNADRDYTVMDVGRDAMFRAIINASKPHGTPVIYFVRCGAYIKIGRSTSVKLRSRLHALQVGSPIAQELLLVVHGIEEDERSVHAYCKPLHHRGEWYRFDPSLTRFIEHLRSGCTPVDGWA